jgi:hypothetical protein
MGTVYKINTNGSGYAVLKRFGGSDGMMPNAGLVLSDGILYGTTRSGGATNISGPYYWGTVFKMNTDSSGYTVLKTFPDSAQPEADLVVSGSVLFGTTISGGSFHNGSVFQMNTDGSSYTVLKSFNVSDGNDPYGGLVLSGTTLYGTATGDSGYTNYGLVFSLTLPPVPPSLATLPQSQTAEFGSVVSFVARGAGFPPPGCQWFRNGTNALEGCTNWFLELTNIQSGDSGAYTLVISNAFGAVTSAPVMLNVIPPVQRRPVPAISVMGDTGSSLNVEYTDSLGFPSSWLPLDIVSLTNPPQYYFDISTPLPPQRFYRAWQTGTPTTLPSLNLNSMATAIPLTGNLGDSLRVDYINRFGPTNAWVTLGTVTLTNTTQLYFDTSAWRQPQRLYRLVQVP